MATIIEFMKGRWMRFGERQRRIELSVQKSVRIGEKAVATVVNFDGEILLLGVTGQTVTLIRRRICNGVDSLPVRGTVE